MQHAGFSGANKHLKVLGRGAAAVLQTGGKKKIKNFTNEHGINLLSTEYLDQTTVIPSTSDEAEQR